MRVILAPTADLARSFSQEKDVVLSVEAEYGSFVAEGSLYTAAHHQSQGDFAGRHLVEGGRPAPCNDENIPLVGKWDHVLVSHVDLDTIGGVMRASGQHPEVFGDEFHEFWDVAEFVDTHGPHKLPDNHPLTPTFYAVWAFVRDSRGDWPRDEVSDVSEFMRLAGEAITAILTGASYEFGDGTALRAAGDALQAATQELNTNSWVQTFGTGATAIVGLRVSEAFTNHLYTDPEGVSLDGVASFNTVQGSISISLADPVPGVSCCQIVQELWGQEAGGHAGIAGSPRGERMGLAQLVEVSQVLWDKLREAKNHQG